MTKLFTNHDRYHIHAILGAVCLMHFAYRWWNLIRFGNAFPIISRTNTSHLLGELALLWCHVLLPLTSLLLPLPQKRNFQAPMIWPEFRLHSLLFASRHVVMTTMAIIWQRRYTTTTDADPTTKEKAFPLGDMLMTIGGIVVQQVTLRLASIISDNYGDCKLRTTNAMPYPTYIPKDQVHTTKGMYRDSQFLAAAMCICGGATISPSLTFMPLLAIQIAPFCMTLVRKGKLSPAYHHLYYAWALWLNLPGMLSMLLYYESDATTYRPIMWSLLTYQLVQHVRLLTNPSCGKKDVDIRSFANTRLSKYSIWIIGPCWGFLVIQACQSVSPWLTQWLSSSSSSSLGLQCPRIVWLSLKLGSATLSVFWENTHILLVSGGTKKTTGHQDVLPDKEQFGNGIVKPILQIVHFISDLVFYGGMALSVAVLLWKFFPH